MQAVAGLALGLVLAIASVEACGTSGSDPRDAGAADASDAADVSDARTEVSPTPFTEQAMRTAADAFNAKYCKAFWTFDAWLFELTFGPGASGKDACLAAGGLVAIPFGEERYFDQLTAPYAQGSKLTPDLLLRCAAELDLSSREAWVKFYVEHEVKDACKPAFEGSLPLGHACGAWNQCASGRCGRNGDSGEGACGVCVEAFGKGQLCVACEGGLTCRGDSGAKVCVRYGGVGEACQAEGRGRLSLRVRDESARPCREDLLCSDGGCVVPPASDAGDEPCDPAVGCSTVPSLRLCDPVTNRCKRARLADDGEPCGPVDAAASGGQTFVACAFGRTCTFYRRVDDVDEHRCRDVGTKTDGQECVAQPLFDNHCKNPASRCFNDRCRRNGPAQCNVQPVVP